MFWIRKVYLFLPPIRTPARSPPFVMPPSFDLMADDDASQDLISPSSLIPESDSRRKPAPTPSALAVYSQSAESHDVVVPDPSPPRPQWSNQKKAAAASCRKPAALSPSPNIGRRPTVPMHPSFWETDASSFQ